MENNKEKKSWIRVLPISLSPPSLDDNTADVDRLIKGLRKHFFNEEIVLDFPMVKKIPSLLRYNNFNLQVSLYNSGQAWYIIDLFHKDDKGFYGISVDLGSTTIVVRLEDIVSRKSIGEASFTNPQTEIGTDILTRLHFASQEKGLERLQSLLIKRLNKEIAQLTHEYGVKKDHIIGMSAAGNTTMTHFFLGLDPFWIFREPYIPVVNNLGLVNSSHLGVSINPRAPIFILPNVGSYLGGDIIAGILSSGMNQEEDVSLLVDVGTNAEVVLGGRDWLMACAGAAGPALEGGVAGMGMMAGPGVIDRVVIDPGSKMMDIRTIGSQPPVGICGSGLIDLVSQMYLAGMIDQRGRYIADKCNGRLRDIEGIKHFVVVSGEDSGTGQDLTLNQPDIDSLLRSKAAMYTILGTITGMVNLCFNDIRRFNIAGTFGSYIDPLSAITLGMIPDLDIDIYRPLGNSSIAGASMTLLSADARDEAINIRDRITYIELNVNQEFMNNFNAARFIPHTDISLFPSVQKRRTD